MDIYKSFIPSVRWVGCCVLLSAFFTGCSENPVTGERQLSLISESREIEMGRQNAEQIRQSMAMVNDPELQAYVNQLGQKLAADSERPDLPWSFDVVDDPTPNAFALPGGPIFVTRGILTLMDSEAELASVLGHEIGHITARHSVAQLSRAQLAQLGLGLGTIFVPEIEPYSDLAGTGLNLLMLKYGRDAERQADELGFRYARSEGYDVNEMADVFASLQRAGDLEGQSAIPGWMATHPAPQERIEAIEARINDLPEDQFGSTVGRAEFLNKIDGMAYGENPRNGFFRDNVFYHPEMAFKFDVPPGWQRQNLAQAVIAASEAQDAALQFTLAGTTGATEALQQFSAREGIQTSGGERTNFNGVSGIKAQFQAQGEQGSVAGYVAYFEHNGRTFQLVTYTSAQALAQYQDTFSSLIQSFSPVTDSAILNIAAPTIEVVSLPRAMSFEQFAKTVPSNIPLERLALINQVQDVNATIPAGTLLKQVKGDVP